MRVASQGAHSVSKHECAQPLRKLSSAAHDPDVIQGVGRSVAALLVCHIGVRDDRSVYCGLCVLAVVGGFMGITNLDVVLGRTGRHSLMGEDYDIIRSNLCRDLRTWRHAVRGRRSVSSNAWAGDEHSSGQRHQQQNSGSLKTALLLRSYGSSNIPSPCRRCVLQLSIGRCIHVGVYCEQRCRLLGLLDVHAPRESRQHRRHRARLRSAEGYVLQAWWPGCAA
mmetsp:Transcript_33661/g.96655  ORF Transcript_33661/g.96655 Transcript_33661/m.96655 type:complete len:223 (-) Transcript_33661:28-696(-)